MASKVGAKVRTEVMKMEEVSLIVEKGFFFRLLCWL